MRRTWPSHWATLVAFSSNHHHPGLLYLLRQGYGATRQLRPEFAKCGTYAILERIRDEQGLTDLEWAIQENLVLEGSFFASYDSLFRYLLEQGFTCERLMSPLRPEEFRSGTG